MQQNLKQNSFLYTECLLRLLLTQKQIVLLDFSVHRIQPVLLIFNNLSMGSYNFSDSTARVLLTTGFLWNGNPENFIKPVSDIEAYITRNDPAVIGIMARSIAATQGRIDEIHEALWDKAGERLSMVRWLFQYQKNAPRVSPEIREVFSTAIARIDLVLTSQSVQ